MRHKAIRQLSQGYSVGKWQSLDSSAGSLVLELVSWSPLYYIALQITLVLFPSLPRPQIQSGISPSMFSEHFVLTLICQHFPH